MFETLPKVVLVTGVVLFSCGGAFALKRFADNPQMMTELCFGLAAYMISNWFWIGILRTDGLAYAVVVCSLSTTIFLTLIGIFVFGEHISVAQTIGLCLALVSIILFSIPTLEVQ